MDLAKAKQMEKYLRIHWDWQKGRHLANSWDSRWEIPRETRWRTWMDSWTETSMGRQSVTWMEKQREIPKRMEIMMDSDLGYPKVTWMEKAIWTQTDSGLD